ncbi:DUF1127 domain-containing protein [Maritimibacter fusiformis]|uniref:DUF1127 domain-containing protein n=1 Tax=Maritimibacter fusiformis TaxID=2603819 RepID=A0A5D0RKB1_9RHOB|nr:DUF1127 domain-containing protein [Maritimibacter fusiformis]TYB80954.1 DUF1127 domain-containing protein [Maritimibacter fusiformis]
MAAYSTSPDIGGRTFATRFSRFWHGVYARIIEAQEQRATRIMLEQLTDRELDDIGLTRWDVARMR